MYEEMIKLERISKTFNTEPVLKGIDAELHAGEILGLSLIHIWPHVRYFQRNQCGGGN